MLACPCTIARSLNGAAAITAECLLSDNTEDGPEAACQLAGKGAANAAIEISFQDRSSRRNGPADRSHTCHDRALQFCTAELHAHSPEESQHDIRRISARLERTVLKGLFQYRTAVI
jgi:hypothetical protein